MAQFPAPTDGILATYFIVSRDVERSRRFYSDVLGGEAVLVGEPSSRPGEWLGHDQRRRRTHRKQADRDAGAAVRSRSRACCGYFGCFGLDEVAAHATLRSRTNIGWCPCPVNARARLLSDSRLG
jgi:catechol 2,3-dioxygenase-like lactoylglutathione lyase family enzyme